METMILAFAIGDVDGDDEIVLADAGCAFVGCCGPLFLFPVRAVERPLTGHSKGTSSDF